MENLPGACERRFEGVDAFRRIKVAALCFLYVNYINSDQKWENYNCVLCSLDLEETTYHLIFECPFSTRCWNFVGISWDHAIRFSDTIQKARMECQHQFFMEVFVISAWEIWKQQNAQIFRGTQASFESWKSCFARTVKLHVH
uniref:Reverse transcriptase zinc-binding domain-containing protein n=1 Tax=Setaria viridis TaxID=4556 RepID=A0A4U6T0C2_SETVI|nr:hypothetical protein SEVIR_9G211400v2 [Setaria viridis]